jgi:hypothetical protein
MDLEDNIKDLNIENQYLLDKIKIVKNYVKIQKYRLYGES